MPFGEDVGAPVFGDEIGDRIGTEVRLLDQREIACFLNGQDSTEIVRGVVPGPEPDRRIQLLHILRRVHYLLLKAVLTRRCRGDDSERRVLPTRWTTPSTIAMSGSIRPISVRTAQRQPPCKAVERLVEATSEELDALLTQLASQPFALAPILTVS